VDGGPDKERIPSGVAWRIGCSGGWPWVSSFLGAGVAFDHRSIAVAAAVVRCHTGACVSIFMLCLVVGLEVPYDAWLGEVVMRVYASF
jgi:hypothetical protein